MPSGPGAIVRTEWNTRVIWLRRSFDLPKRPGDNVRLLVHHDEDANIYLNDVLAARGSDPRRPSRTPRTVATVTRGTTDAEAGDDDIQSRLKARETPQPRFCWHCRKPLHARSDRCPFCGEAQ